MSKWLMKNLKANRGSGRLKVIVTVCGSLASALFTMSATEVACTRSFLPLPFSASMLNV